MISFLLCLALLIIGYFGNFIFLFGRIYFLLYFSLYLLHLYMGLSGLSLLDEPTNDIDVNTLRALEEGLEDFAGIGERW